MHTHVCACVFVWVHPSAHLHVHMHVHEYIGNQSQCIYTDYETASNQDSVHHYETPLKQLASPSYETIDKHSAGSDDHTYSIPAQRGHNYKQDYDNVNELEVGGNYGNSSANVMYENH